MEAKYEEYIKATTKDFLGIIAETIYQNKDKLSKCKSKAETFRLMMEELNVEGGTDDKAVISKRTPKDPSKATKTNTTEKRSMESVLKHYADGGEEICGYMSTKSPSTDLICGVVLSDKEKGTTDNKLAISNKDITCYRCTKCSKNKTNRFKEKLDSVKKAPVSTTKVQTGFNVTDSKNNTDTKTNNTELEKEISFNVTQLENATGYLFSADDEFPGIVFKQINDDVTECIGIYLVEDNPEVFTSSYELPDNWKSYISEKLSESELAYIKNLDISLVPEKKDRRGKRNLLNDDDK